MLTPDDALLVQREPDLPALATLLDEAALLAAVRRCPGMEHARSARCGYLRYKPHTSCLARLKVVVGQEERLWIAKAHRPDVSDKIAGDKIASDKMRKSLGASSEIEASPWRTKVLSDLALVFQPFPHDSKLPYLAALRRDESRQGLIGRLLPAIPMLATQTSLQDVASQDCHLETLRYKPERRYVARFDCQSVPRAVLKMYSAAEYGPARRAVKTLGNLAGVPTARPLGHSDRYQTLLLEWLQGPSLDEWLSTAQWDASLGSRVGECLADLHRQKTNKLPLRTVENEIDSLREAADGLCWLVHDLASRLGRLVPKICCQMACAPAGAVPIHGDFDPSQVLVLDGAAADSIGLIDLDQAALGNPFWDLGNFLAHLQRKVSFGQLSEVASEQVWAALLSGYQETAGRVDPRQLAVYAAARLVQLAHEPFRYRSQNWRAQIDLLLDRAERLLEEPHRVVATQGAGRASGRDAPWVVVTSSHAGVDGAGQGRAQVEVVDPFVVVSDPAMSFLPEAIDPQQAEEALSEALAATQGTRTLRLRAIRVVRYKPGRRCMIEYTLAQGDGTEPIVVLGKAHAKGKHRTCYELQSALWEAGFDDRAADGITVARALGTIPSWHLWLQEKLPGRTAWHALQTGQANQVAARIARAAYKLHEVELPTRRRHTIDTELEILSQRLTRLARMRPRDEKRISDILAACRNLADELPQTTPVCSHRDFYPDQILVDGGRIHVLDHDLFCLGDVGLDLGNFCGHLIEYSLRAYGRPGHFAECQEAMIEQYIRLAGSPTRTRAAIEIYTTLTLVRHIDLSTQFQERKQATTALLAHCEQRLAAWMTGC